MARTSRKNKPDTINVKTNVLQTAIYIRLSEEDGKGRSSSVDTQKQIIENYIAIAPDLETYDTYIDNGSTGRNFDRLEFQRMLADIEAHKIDCVICKDLSRLGRNSIDTGYYIEKHFPLHHVRFIAVTDDFDSANPNSSSSGIMLSLKNMINEAYSMDIGKKVKVQQEQAIKDGQFIGAKSPYGYKKDPNDCHKLIVDEYSSVVVKRIFDMVLGGVGLAAICRIFNEEGIPSPSHYSYQKGYTSNSNIGSGHWQTRTLQVILKSETYIGNLVQGRSDSFNRKQKKKDSSEWVKVEHTHAPIVSNNVFEEVQKIRESAYVKLPITCTQNIFKGKIFCGDCGKNLHRQKVVQKKAGEIYIFHCISKYRIKRDFCDSHIHLKEEDMMQTVLSIIEKQATAIFGMSLSIKQKKGVIDRGLKSQHELLSELSKDMAKNKKFLKSLYENLASGILDIAEYKELKQGYGEKIEQSRTEYCKVEMQIKDLKEEIIGLKNLTKSLKSISKDMTLSRKIVDNLIDKIVINGDEQMEIYFKFENAFPRLTEVIADEK